jgi:hypothetical protein
MQVLNQPGHVQLIGVGISIITVVAAAINVYVGLRLAALQSKLKADSASLEVALLRQFVTWKDEILTMLNGKYVSDRLVAEIHMNLEREIAVLNARMDRIEKRCEERPKDCLALRCQPPE